MVSSFCLDIARSVFSNVVYKWPYTYETCDVGTLPNQTYPGTTNPIWATSHGDKANNNELVSIPLESWLQRIDY